MPKKIVTKEWECNICHKRYKKKSLAKKCEALGKLEPKYAIGQVFKTISEYGPRFSYVVDKISWQHATRGRDKKKDMHILYYKLISPETGKVKRYGQKTIQNYLDTRRWKLE